MTYDYNLLKTLPFADHKFEKLPRIAGRDVFQLEKTGDTVTVFRAHGPQDVPDGLLDMCHEEFNHVVEEGRTYPHYLPMDKTEFLEYLFVHFAAIWISGEYTEEMASQPKEFWRSRYLGHFYVKPNYIGRCSHVCNAGFIVYHEIRGKGLGKEMGRKYLEWAPKLGYVYSVFNLVYETNVASARIWKSLGFEQIGYIKNVAVLKGEDKLVGAYMFGKDLV